MVDRNRSWLKSARLSHVTYLIACYLSFLHVESDGSVRMDMLKEFYSLADVEEIHSVAGETNIIFKVPTRDSMDLEKLIEKLNVLLFLAPNLSAVLNRN